MAVSEDFRAYVLEQLDRAIPQLRAKEVFGGVGLYFTDILFGIILEGALYLKVNKFTRSQYEAYGMGPFKPFGEEGSPVQYYRVPEAILENPEALRNWAREALAVALEKKAMRIAADKGRKRRSGR
jgi:DNA transformation protein